MVCPITQGDHKKSQTALQQNLVRSVLSGVTTVTLGVSDYSPLRHAVEGVGNDYARLI